MTAGPGTVTNAHQTRPHHHIPRATYRLQFNHALTFRDAQALVPYLSDLGISDVYASPFLKARSTSTHGYDICDHSQLNPAIGTEEEFDAFTAALQSYGMGMILDVVPNHMGINAPCNEWWMDVLENGPSSIYAAYFDIDWQPTRPELENKVLLPILGDQYGDVLERGELRLSYQDGAFFITYYDIKLPVAPRTYEQILNYRLDELIQSLGEDHPHVQELQSILTAIHYLPPRMPLPPEKIAERNREKEIIKRRLAALYEASPDVSALIEETVRVFNGTVGDPHSFDLLDRLLDDQAYRPAYWRVAAEEINYRRFFDINELAAIRVELPEVFQATHQLVFRFLAQGQARGLRIDHPDGLLDPGSYFQQLQQRYAAIRDQGSGIGDQEEGAQSGVPGSHPLIPDPQLLYVVAEKILSPGETLPQDWPVAGTTGYDFLNAVNGLFVEQHNREAFDRVYSQFVQEPLDFASLVNSAKKMIMLVALVSEVNELSHQLECIAERNRRYRDFTLNSLTFALREVIACLPVYRTYITAPDMVMERDRAAIEAAVAAAKRRNPRTAESIFDFIRDTLLLRNVDRFPPEDLEKLLAFVLRFQQISGPVMAKGVEDTAFYVYNRLVSLNEVGGHPEQFGAPVEEFHHQNIQRQAHWPHAMLTTSTHDTKRSEDVRARINVLSELPDAWQAALARWSAHNAAKKTLVGNEPAPDRNDEYLLYQTLLGAWPFDQSADSRGALTTDYAAFSTRIADYMHKATKEAKRHTSWINPNEAYDRAVRDFVAAILDGTDTVFLDDIRAFGRRIAYFGQFNSLSQVLLKLTSPGVPDIYQGTELWDFSLVDPDNRRPVDYDRRRAYLADLQARIADAGEDRSGLTRSLLDTGHDGRMKLYLIYRTLNFRRANADLFTFGSYRQLHAHGARGQHVCAFARQWQGSTALVVAPCRVVGLTGGIEQPPLGAAVWHDTWLALPDAHAGQQYRNLFTGAVVDVQERDGMTGMPLAVLCRDFPVGLFALLE